MITPEKITATSSPEQLPDDIQTLKQMVLTLLDQIDDLSGQLHYLKRQLFGRKSEKMDPNQRLLFEGLYEEVQEKLNQRKGIERDKQAAPRKNAHHKGRRPLPEHLPREVIEIEPEEPEKTCAVCHHEKQRIGSEETEKLEYVPASFKVLKYVRHKYACKNCQGHVAIGSLPPMAIDKGVAGEGLLAHIITSKYCDHIPLNRLSDIYSREDVDLNVSTMCDYVGNAADLLEPLVGRMREKILQSPKINTDDTPIPVKSPKRKGATYKGYLWVYIDGDHNVVFDFTPNRSRHGPINFLGDYNGYVQADAYSGYDEFFRTSKAVEVGCNSHARRKFDYALDSDPVRAANMLSLYGELYEIEERAKEGKYNRNQLLQLRQTEAKPILEQMRKRLDEWKLEVLPQSPIGKAVTYALNQWEALIRYLDDPILEIDNNLSERTLRMVAVGRKNYLFAGSESGGRRAAILYSLVASCKLNGHDPFAYFNDVLRKISTHPADRIDELLPSNWKSPKSNSTDNDHPDNQPAKVG